MKWQDGITEALKEGKCFSQGNHAVISECSKHSGGYSCEVYYYGNKVFEYELNPLLKKPDSEKFSYDFCGHEGYPLTTKLICCCLEAVGAKYRVKTVKGKVVEVPVKTTKRN